MHSAAPGFSTATSFPEGLYASITFSGGAGKTPVIYQRLLEYIKDNDLKRIGNPIEFWHVHEYISDDPKEYIQTLEQRVEPLSDE